MIFITKTPRLKVSESFFKSVYVQKHTLSFKPLIEPHVLASSFIYLVFLLIWMVTFHAVLLMVYTFRNLLGLLLSAIMLRTSMRVINVKQPNFSSRAIGIMHFEEHFLNFIADTMN